jgi:hypothetical protein
MSAAPNPRVSTGTHAKTGSQRTQEWRQRRRTGETADTYNVRALAEERTYSAELAAELETARATIQSMGAEMERLRRVLSASEAQRAIIAPAPPLQGKPPQREDAPVMHATLPARCPFCRHRLDGVEFR